MIDFQLFIINLLCIIGASFLAFTLLTFFKIADTGRAGLAIFLGCIIVLVIYCWINVPQIACGICTKSIEAQSKCDKKQQHAKKQQHTKKQQVAEKMTNFNNDTPKFVSEQDGLILPENINGTIRTDINLDKFLKYGYMSNQLKEAMMFQKMYGGTNPPPSITATTQIVPPFSDVVIPVDPVLIATVVPEYVRPANNTPDQQLVQNEIATTEKDVMEVPEVVVNSIESPDGTIESFTTNPTKIMLFFSPHCGYCKDFMKPNGVWQKVKKVIRDYVEIVEINSDVNPQKLREFNVSYFPCLMKIKDNNVYEFTDARTFENVEKFCLN